MEKVGKKFDSFEEMERANKKEASSLSPEERLLNLTRLKRQYLAFNDMTDDDLNGHLRESRIKKVPLPWLND